MNIIKKRQIDERSSHKNTKKLKRSSVAGLSDFTNPKHNLSVKFKHINDRLMNEATSSDDILHCGNIFKDILKVTPIINLDTMENQEQEAVIKNTPKNKSPKLLNNNNSLLKPSQKTDAMDHPSASASSSTNQYPKEPPIIDLTETVGVDEIRSAKQKSSPTKKNITPLRNDKQNAALPNQFQTNSFYQSRYDQISSTTSRLNITSIRTPNTIQPTIPLSTSSLYQARFFLDIKKDEPNSLPSQYVRKPLKVVSYNILCQNSMNSTKHLYKHIRNASKFWDFSYRWGLITKEIEKLNSDVYCLQEVEDIHYIEFIQPFFQQKGFEGIYTRRTNDFPDGCATFFNQNVLTLISRKDVLYNLQIPTMDRDNIGQIIVFGINGTNSCLCISNTHIYFNMKRGEVKLAQLAYFLANQSRVSEEIQELKKHFVGHIICGDFNIWPKSPIYRFILERYLNMTLFDRYGLAHPVESERFLPLKAASNALNLMYPRSRVNLPLDHMKISANCEFAECLLHGKESLEMRHKFHFASVYEHEYDGEDHREISMYMNNEARSPDLILYSVVENNLKDSLPSERRYIVENFIQLNRRLSLPTHAQLNSTCGPLPNEQSGSDHLPLCALFDLICTKS